MRHGTQLPSDPEVRAEYSSGHADNGRSRFDRVEEPRSPRSPPRANRSFLVDRHSPPVVVGAGCSLGGLGVELDSQSLTALAKADDCRIDGRRPKTGYRSQPFYGPLRLCMTTFG